MRRVRGLLRISLSYNILLLFSTDASIYVSFSPSYGIAFAIPGTFLFRAVVYEVRRAVFRAAGVLRFIRIRRCLLLERHTERARGNSDGFSYTTDAVVIRSLSAGKRRECGTFYFRERQRPPSATHEPVGLSLRRASTIFSMRPSDIFTRQGTNTPAYCPERKAGWVSRRRQPAYRSFIRSSG